MFCQEPTNAPSAAPTMVFRRSSVSSAMTWLSSVDALLLRQLEGHRGGDGGRDGGFDLPEQRLFGGLRRVLQRLGDRRREAEALAGGRGLAIDRLMEAGDIGQLLLDVGEQDRGAAACRRRLI